MKRNHKGLLLAAALFFAAMAAVSGYQLYKISKEYKAGDEDLRQMYAAMESAGERAKEKTPEMSLKGSEKCFATRRAKLVLWVLYSWDL